MEFVEGKVSGDLGVIEITCDAMDCSLREDNLVGVGVVEDVYAGFQIVFPP